MEQPLLEQVQNLDGLSSTELLVTVVVGLIVLGLVVKYLLRGALTVFVVALGMWMFDAPEGVREIVGKYKDLVTATIEPVVDRFVGG
ncbi:MAG: hypothetical protein HN979_01085 [Actinobacteria bacterium]|jgi:hypothetical protein|nr:hypothetical protein [Actinomycetota bacterium]MBT3687863.1 hypothetical protein [Actinomycetota bacterium]MBT4036586.1 hypothetical protein [Actinomycetota bacterium]MBT4278675.1 hypothetical protein [Actinomycetota bacterium]MBT4342435.1 hypothetical protein [Actinomycetota bacterium]